METTEESVAAVLHGQGGEAAMAVARSVGGGGGAAWGSGRGEREVRAALL